MPIERIQHNTFTWINIVDITPADVDQLRRDLPYIHPLNLEDLLSVMERPKIDEHDQYLFVVMQLPQWDRVERITRSSEVDFIVGRNVLVTAHDGDLKPLVMLFERVQSSSIEREKWMGHGANDAFYAVVDRLVDYLFPILNKVDSNIHHIEDGLFTENSRHIIQEIAVVRRDIIALRRIIRHLVPVLEQLERTEHPVIRDELEEYFGDTVDHGRLARDIIDENYEVITGLSDTANTLASHRLNDVMRILTVISVLILPLTLIAGIYGMNIDLPLDEHPAAFLTIMGIMLVISILMILYFIRRKWL
ncbi:MAG: magnesium transporter CorA family protein [Chloroflexi bacterium]|nr:magnesium transporter CorA family protein [Chloroflexota bacterium]